MVVTDLLGLALATRPVVSFWNGKGLSTVTMSCTKTGEAITVSLPAQHHQGLAAYLVEGLASDGEDGGYRVCVQHCGVVAGQKTLDEGQDVNFHLAIILDTSQAELVAKDQLH